MPLGSFWHLRLFCETFHDFDFVGGQAVKVIHQCVNLAVEAVAAVVLSRGFQVAKIFAICSGVIKLTLKFWESQVRFAGDNTEFTPAAFAASLVQK